MVERSSFIDPQDRWDTGGLDMKDPGVHDLTVKLHHHLKLLVLFQTFIYIHCWEQNGYLWSASSVVVSGRKEKVISAERDHIEGVSSSVDLIKEIAVSVVRGVVDLQFVA